MEVACDFDQSTKIMCGPIDLPPYFRPHCKTVFPLLALVKSGSGLWIVTEFHPTCGKRRPATAGFFSTLPGMSERPVVKSRSEEEFASNCIPKQMPRNGLAFADLRKGSTRLSLFRFAIASPNAPTPGRMMASASSKSAADLAKFYDTAEAHKCIAHGTYIAHAIIDYD